MALTGAPMAVLGFGEVIARKSLGADALSITILTMLSPLTALTTIWWTWLLVRRHQGKLLTGFGLAALGALVTGAAMRTMAHLLAMGGVFYLAWSVFGPAESRVMQRHMPAGRTGRTFGTALGVRMALTAAVSAAAGWYLDRHPGGWRELFPAGAAVGAAGLAALVSIPTGEPEEGAPRLTARLFAEPVRQVLELLRARPDFLRFELAFMVYGVAFMMLMPVVPIYLVDELQLSYSTIGLSRGALAQLVMIPAMPLFGKLFDRSTPHRMSAVVFALLAGYPLLLLGAGATGGTARVLLVYAAFAWFGVMMSGLTIVWHLSTLRFARNEEVGVYQSVHVAATGVRGLAAPLLGYAVMTWLGMEAAMGAAAALWLMSAAAMVWIRRYDRRHGWHRSLRAA